MFSPFSLPISISPFFHFPLSDDQLDEDTKAELIHGLTLDGARVEDLAITMEYSPSSKVANTSNMLLNIT